MKLYIDIMVFVGLQLFRWISTELFHFCYYHFSCSSITQQVYIYVNYVHICEIVIFSHYNNFITHAYFSCPVCIITHEAYNIFSPVVSVWFNGRILLQVVGLHAVGKYVGCRHYTSSNNRKTQLGNDIISHSYVRR